MDWGVADEAVVVVKRRAGEGMGDLPEGKTRRQRQEVGGEGRNMTHEADDRNSEHQRSENPVRETVTYSPRNLR